MIRDPNYVLPLPARKPIDLADRELARHNPSRPRIAGRLSIKDDRIDRADKG